MFSLSGNEWETHVYIKYPSFVYFRRYKVLKLARRIWKLVEWFFLTPMEEKLVHLSMLTVIRRSIPMEEAVSVDTKIYVFIHRCSVSNLFFSNIAKTRLNVYSPWNNIYCDWSLEFYLSKWVVVYVLDCEILESKFVFQSLLGRVEKSLFPYLLVK